MSEIQSQKFVQDIKQFNCPNCGNQLQLINKKTKYVGCNYCGTVSDPHSEVSKIIMKLNSPSKYPPFSFLKIGMSAVIHGFKYKIIGRTRWQTTHMEYWKEGYYEGYGTEKWVYDEWLLMGERFDYFYIVEDAEGFYISKNIIPSNPILPSNNIVLSWGIDPDKNQKAQPLNEAGSAKVIFFEGETTYQIKPGDAIHYASYDKKGISYVIEWRVDDHQFEVKEVEFFEEKKLSIDELKKWFSKDSEANQNIFLQFERYNWTKKILGWVSVICLILALIDYQPYVLNEAIKPSVKILNTEKKEISEIEKNTFDSVYVQEKNGEKAYALNEDMLVQESSYSELKDTNLEFSVLTIDTLVKQTYNVTISTKQSEIIKYPFQINPNFNYYFNFNPELMYAVITDKNSVALDTIYEYGWKKWQNSNDGYVMIFPRYTNSNESLQFTIQKELYSSFGMLLASFIFACLWILYLPISEWVFRFKSVKK